MTDQPKLPLTVPLSLWEAVASAVHAAFADSYLSGATINGAALQAKTNIARIRILGSSPTMRVLADFGLTVAEPLPAPVAQRAWSWPSEAEYESYSLADKIWSRGKMSMHELGLAGPQTLPPDQMPVAWHEHRAKAENHKAEADRLKSRAQAR